MCVALGWRGEGKWRLRGCSLNVQVLWTDEQVAGLTLFNQAAFDAAPNFGEKSDILRYELLYAFGGVYVDVDLQCVGNLAQLCQVRVSVTRGVWVGVMATSLVPMAAHVRACVCVYRNCVPCFFHGCPPPPLPFGTSRVTCSSACRTPPLLN